MNQSLTPTLEQLLHYRFGPIWDGHVPSKADRDRLVDAGWITRSSGFQFLSPSGVTLLAKLGYLTEDTNQLMRPTWIIESPQVAP